ncbi:hypothetical protein K1719_031789 [Acacia pycnantha]|nr:hypothetical protein K1719_031789 [Acacia pycnantha]
MKYDLAELCSLLEGDDGQVAFHCQRETRRETHSLLEVEDDLRHCWCSTAAGCHRWWKEEEIARGRRSATGKNDLVSFFQLCYSYLRPHAVYYSSTPLSEYDTLGTSIKVAVVYLVTTLVKLVCLATFLKVFESDSFDPYQAVVIKYLLSHEQVGEVGIVV